MDNAYIARALQDIALLLEVKGENPFKIRSYANAAQLIEKMSEPVSVLVEENRLRDIGGIGDALEKKITELVTTGELEYLNKLRKQFPKNILELLSVEGLGPRSVKALYETLGIGSIKELRKACEKGKVSEVSGFTKKRERRILDALEFMDKQSNHFRLNTALLVALTLRARLLEQNPTAKVEVAGSVRRFREVVKDVDLVATAVDTKALMQSFVTAPEVERVVASGKTKSTVVAMDGVPVDLRVVTAEQFSFAYLHFTGSKEHNILLRRRAADIGLRLNEYGLFREDGDSLNCKDEAAIYAALDLPFLPPEVREGIFELELQPPIKLVEPRELRGVVHCHSSWSDGLNSIPEMAEAARQIGYTYIVITDHSRSSGYINGLTPERVHQQHAEIDELNDMDLSGFRILKGIESDILNDGSLDYDPEVLREFDFIIASVHSHFEMTEAEATHRIICAIENPFTSAIGHLTGRLLLTRRGYAVDVDKVVDAAAANGVAFEINANPRRLDMDWRHLRRAAEKGVRFVIGPDAHRLAGLNNMRYGLGIARKGALTSEHILNCLPVEQFLQWRKS